MPRAWPETHLTNGTVVGFKLKKSRDGDIYFVFFNDRRGRRREVSTGCTGIEKARVQVRTIIDDEYAAPDEADRVSWDEATARLNARLRAAGVRPVTADYYLRLVAHIRAAHPATDGPADLTPSMAQAWADGYVTGTKRNGKPRSQHTAFSVVRGACVLWQKWFVEQLKVCPVSPFADVQPPKTDRPQVRLPDDNHLTDFLAWINERFGGWELPRLFVEVKLFTGCRVSDVCQLRSDQLRDGRLHFDPDQTKGRKGRAVPLPPDLYSRLEAIKGPRYLWQSLPTGLRAALKVKKWPTHWLKPDFRPSRMVAWVMTLFDDFNAAEAERAKRDNLPERPRLTSHMLRKLAFTTAWEAGIDPRKAAVAIGCNVDTMLKHYVRLDEQATTDEVFGDLGAKLRLPPHTTQTPPAAPNHPSEGEGSGA